MSIARANLTARQIFRVASVEQAIKIPHTGATTLEVTERMLETADRIYQYFIEADKKRGPDAS